MSATVLASLAGLALLDSVSVGTLVIPVLLLLQAHLRPGHLAAYLGTVLVFYVGVGMVLLAVADRVRALDVEAFDGPAVDIAQIALAVALLALSEYLTPAKQAARLARETPGSARRSPVVRWQARVLAGDARYRVMIALAMIAAGIELASMLPYLAAVGIIATNGLPLPTSLALLFAYSAVMIAPAALLAAIRYALGPRAERLLRPLNAWLAQHSASALSWVVGIVAVLLFLDGISRLFGR